MSVQGITKVTKWTTYGDVPVGIVWTGYDHGYLVRVSRNIGCVSPSGCAGRGLNNIVSSRGGGALRATSQSNVLGPIFTRSKVVRVVAELTGNADPDFAVGWEGCVCPMFPPKTNTKHKAFLSTLPVSRRFTNRGGFKGPVLKPWSPTLSFSEIRTRVSLVTAGSRRSGNNIPQTYQGWRTDDGGEGGRAKV